MSTNNKNRNPGINSGPSRMTCSFNLGGTGHYRINDNRGSSVLVNKSTYDKYIISATKSIKPKIAARSIKPKIATKK